MGTNMIWTIPALKYLFFRGSYFKYVVIFLKTCSMNMKMLFEQNGKENKIKIKYLD